MKIKEALGNEEFSPLWLGNTEITKITYKCEEITEGCAYFHLPSEKRDSYEYRREVVSRGPRVIICERAEDFLELSALPITVKSTRRAFAYAASILAGIDWGGVRFIGVTGTNGKTSTASFLRAILEYSGIGVGFIGTGKITSRGTLISPPDYSMTTPDCEILYPAIKRMIDDGCGAIVMEVSSHALAYEKCAPIPFDIGIFTGLSTEHMDFHGSMEKYFLEKEKLFLAAKRAIVNYDDKYGKRLYEKYKEKTLCAGILWQKDIYASDIEYIGLDGIKYFYRTKSFITPIRLMVAGAYNIYNSMLAIGAAGLLGITPAVCREALSHLYSLEGRCESVSTALRVIIDYAHTPFALENLLKTVNSVKNPRQKIILVFGCGGNRDKEKRPVMARVAEKYADIIIVTTDNSREENPTLIIRDITAGFEKNKYGVIYDRAAAIRHAISVAGREDIVIIAGKGHEKYIITENGYSAFDERKIIKEALFEKGISVSDNIEAKDGGGNENKA